MQINRNIVTHYFKYNIKTLENFATDIAIFKKVERMFEKIYISKNVSLPILINRIIILSNLFGMKNVTNYFLINAPKHHYQILKTLLVYVQFVDKYKFLNLINIDEKLLARLKSHD